MMSEAGTTAATTTTSGTIVVVTKVPRNNGTCKTRLIPVLGAQGATRLAIAMLKDVVSAINQVSCHKVLLYAPGTDDAKVELEQLLQTELHLNNLDSNHTSHSEWILMQMEQQQQQSSNTNDNLTSSNLTYGLTCAIETITTSSMFSSTSSSLVFVGMDAPELPLDEIQQALQLPYGHALLCPSSDGGYGLLGISTTASNPDSQEEVQPHNVFQDVLWSHPLTALSQLKACQLAGYTTIQLGRLMHDIDDQTDVEQLCQRLRMAHNYSCDGRDVDNDDSKKYQCLMKSSKERSRDQVNDHNDPSVLSNPCTHTRQALADLGILRHSSLYKSP